MYKSLALKIRIVLPFFLLGILFFIFFPKTVIAATNCNSNPVCTGCANPNNNTCGNNNGIGTGCVYTGYGGSTTNSCTSVTAPDQPNYCNYTAGCFSGYSCVNDVCYQDCSIGTCGGACADATMRYVTGSSQTCGSWFSSAGCYAFNSCSCTSGPTYGACTPQVNTCSTNNGTQTVTLYYTPRGDTYCTPLSYQQNCTQSNCSTNYSCSLETCVTNITVTSYIDTNHNGNFDSTENPFALLSTAISGHGSGITDANGKYIFSGLSTGTYSVSLTAPDGYAVTNTNPATVNLTSTNADAQVYFGLTAMEISGQVFVDYYHNGETSEYNGEQGTLSINGVRVPLDGAGKFTYTPPTVGTYTVTYTPSSTYINWGTNSRTYTITDTTPQVTNVAFSITPIFRIKGLIYNDVNKSSYFTSSTDPLLSTGTLTETGPTSKTVTINSDGTYTIEGLLSGEYTLKYTPPLGYEATYPPNATTNVVVGAPCNTHQNHDNDTTGQLIATSCDAYNNIDGLNFGVTNEFAWIQGICSDLRIDNGFTNKIPATADCNGTSAPYANICNSTDAGIIFSGNQNADFGLGNASANNWIVGGSGYPESFLPVNQTVIRTSYSYTKTSLKQAAITPIELSTKCTIPDCTLPKDLASGVYEVNDNLVIEPWDNGNISFTIQPINPYPRSDYPELVYPEKHIVLLISGTTTIKGKIIIPSSTKSTFTLISKGNIIVEPQVGESSIYSLSSDLDGLYSTDASFVVQSASTTGNSCQFDGTTVDKKLNIAGSVIVNAGETGGSFQNARDLCEYDASCPTTTFSLRTDFLLNAQDVLKRRNSTFEEQSP